MPNKKSSFSTAGLTQLEKLINNIFVMKVVTIIKKLFYLKQKKSSVFLSGFTLIESLIVIAIIAIFSVFYVINLRPDTLELLRMDSTRLAADIRYIRSMSASRAIYNNTTFPTGGYGIEFKNGDGSSIKSYYQLYAADKESGNIEIIKKVYLSNVAFRLVDSNSRLSKEDAINDQGFKNFAFVSENSVTTSGLSVNANGEYQIEIYYSFLKVIGGVSKSYYYIAKINIGQKTADEFVWSNLSTTYDTNTPVCGNGVVESGEACEPLDTEGNFNSNCTPSCEFNICGDGYILGSEECEYNGTSTGIQCEVSSFCYVCWAMQKIDSEDGNFNGCTTFSADGTEIPTSSCCGGTQWESRTTPPEYTCLNCQRTTAICPTSCSDPRIRPGS